MVYGAEIKLSGSRGAWSGAAPSSCPDVDLEVIEEYLQENLLEIQPAHTSTSSITAVGQQAHTHQDSRIIGKDKNWAKSQRVEQTVSKFSELNPFLLVRREQLVRPACV